MRILIDNVYSDYRQAGFPHYALTLTEKRQQYRKLVNYDHAKLFGDVVGQTMHALGLAWSYFRHAAEIRCRGMRTPMEAFNDPDLFRIAIEKALQYGGKTVTPSGIRKALRYVCGTQGVSNFRPTAAAAIYHHLLPEQGGTVWNPSGGFGGCLLGAFACHRVRRYIACEPAKATFRGLERMAEELSTIIDPDRQLQVKHPNRV
jgi:hypothetical protein